MRTCTIEGCERRLFAGGWCNMHYQRNRRHGDPLTLISPFQRNIDAARRATLSDEQIAARFWSKVDKGGPMPVPGTLAHERCSDEPCWLWTGACSKQGYGFGVVGLAAHRLSYQLHGGALTTGLVVDHLCRVTQCVNPAHLEQVTPGENTRRGHVGLGGYNRRPASERDKVARTPQQAAEIVRRMMKGQP